MNKWHPTIITGRHCRKLQVANLGWSYHSTFGAWSIGLVKQLLFYSVSFESIYFWQICSWQGFENRRRVLYITNQLIDTETNCFVFSDSLKLSEWNYDFNYSRTSCYIECPVPEKFIPSNCTTSTTYIDPLASSTPEISRGISTSWRHSTKPSTASTLQTLLVRYEICN